jgi:hypothetical protein
MSTDQSGFEDGGRKWIFGQLCEQSESLSQLLLWPFLQRTLLKCNLASRFTQSAERVQRECLACAIAAEKAGDRTSAYLEAKRSHQRAACNFHVEICATEQHGVRE